MMNILYFHVPCPSHLQLLLACFFTELQIQVTPPQTPCRHHSRPWLFLSLHPTISSVSQVQREARREKKVGRRSSEGQYIRFYQDIFFLLSVKTYSSQCVYFNCITWFYAKLMNLHVLYQVVQSSQYTHAVKHFATSFEDQRSCLCQLLLCLGSWVEEVATLQLSRT